MNAVELLGSFKGVVGKNKQQVSNEKLHIKLIIFGLRVLSFIVSVEHCYENAE